MRRVTRLLVATLPLLAGLVACTPDDREAELAALSRWEDQRLAPADSLRSLISGPDAFVRRAAVRTAGLIGRTEPVPAMLAALEDPSQAVRAQAAFSLGLLGGDVAVPPLTEVLQDDHMVVRVAACEGLAHQRHDGAMLYEPALHGEVREAIAAWTALRNVAEWADHDSLVAAIRGGLARPETEIRWRVLRCAERMPDSTLVSALAAYATDRDVQVRVHALRALGHQPGPDALEAVLASSDHHDRLRGRDLARVELAELRALASLAGPAFAADQEGEYTSLAGRAATRLGRGAANPDPQVAAAALDAMAAAVRALPLPPEAAIRESLLPVWRLRLVGDAHGRLEDPDPTVRAAACAAFGALRGRAAAPEIMPLLTDAEPATAAAAFAALMDLGPDHGQACRGCRALTERHGHAGEAAILAALPAYVARLREQGLLARAVITFPREGDPACLPSFAWWRAVRGLQSEDFVVRAEAASLLASFPGERSRRILLAAWRAERARSDVDVELALLSALGSLFAAGLTDTVGFEPHCDECLFFEELDGTPARLAAADSAFADPAAPADPRAEAAAILGEAFDDPDLRVRVAARDAARATDLLAPNLIPAVASLRETRPAFQRDPGQPLRRLPFAAPRVRCVTDRGSFVIELDAEIAPNTCAAFLGLIARGFHDSLTFHRVVPDFVIQGGCPRGDGWGGPGWTIRSEASRRPFERGTVGIADSGLDTGGSQWFVCHSPQPHLDGRYTVFGQVVEGLEVIDRIQRGDRYRLEILTK